MVQHLQGTTDKVQQPWILAVTAWKSTLGVESDVMTKVDPHNYL